MHRLKIGIIGCGVIGGAIAKACQERLADKVNLYAICDADEKKALALNSKLKKKVFVLKVDDAIKAVDLIVEAASAGISAGIVEKCIKNKKDCMVMSVGGLLGREALLDEAKARGIKLYIPSGALCGIDGLKSAGIGRINSVTLTTRKPIKGLEGAPYLKEKNIVLSNIKEETKIFEGTALDAMKGFPQNINVSAVLSLAGIGAKKTRVRIITSPLYTKNIHEVEVAGEFGRLSTRTENVPSKINPKTSELAVFAAIAMLEGITSSVRIGT